MRRAGLVMLICAGSLLTGCQSVYYGAMEKVGIHKRDIMVDRVSDARDAQDEAKEQFKDALEHFSSVVEVDGGNLEKKYNKLNKAYEASEAKAENVKARIAAVEGVSKALFKEWKAELKTYSSAELRRASEAQYEQTQDKYEQLMDSMKEAASKMDPVLVAFRDQVLFLKHNLNSRAIASIQNEAADIKAQVTRLVREMEASIADADAFIKELGVGGA